MRKTPALVFCFFLFLFLAGCNEGKQIVDTDINQQTSGSKTQQSDTKTKETVQENQNKQNAEDQQAATPDQKTDKTPVKSQSPAPDQPTTPAPPAQNQNDDGIAVVAQPESIPVLVNKHFKLPDGYAPKDLVTTTIPFVSSATAEKRKLRSEAAAAIAQLFAGAKAQGVNLLGVSGYRSHATQVSLFNYYVSKDGYEKARTYSALPGTSEHETGLAIDVTGGDGRCAAQDCFGGTAEANWLQAHAEEFGFIIRYPNGKEAITGYKYEPWHLRYVGKSIAADIMGRSITLEEYFNAVPVSK
ncbi:D-alanyl-D-alanine carboxypeptidase family protein [Neobacillus sp. LXY-4]|uniref:M15 family metallopeptidase n=1 Tax=Neobacillus sp. LXY-4 TaxID=3379826 RepID=UPI003EE0A717